MITLLAACGALLAAQLCPALFDRAPRAWRSWAFALLTLGAIGALTGMALLPADQRLAAFGCGVAVWCWQELGFAGGRRWCGFAIATRPAHELTWLGPLLLVLLVSWGTPHALGRSVFLVLLGVHFTLRLCAAATHLAQSSGPLVAPPWFAPGLPAARLLSLVFPLAVTGTAGLGCALLARGAASGDIELALLALPLCTGSIGLWETVRRVARPAAVSAAGEAVRLPTEASLQ